MTDDEHSPKPDPDASAVVPDLLAELPRPAIPPDVSARIRAVIASESQSRSAQERSNVRAIRRSSRIRRLLPVVASAAAIALIGLLVWPLADNGVAPETLAVGPGCTVNADVAADMSPVLHSSGMAYTEASLVTQAESVARQTKADCDLTVQAESKSLHREDGSLPEDSALSGDESSSSGDPSVGTDDGPGVAPDSGEGPQLWPVPTPSESVPSTEGRVPASEQNGDRRDQQDLKLPADLRSEPVVRRCVVSVVAGRLLHSVDVATFDGKTAVVVVVTSPREVLALRCGRGGPKVLAQRTMAR